FSDKSRLYQKIHSTNPTDDMVRNCRVMMVHNRKVGLVWQDHGYNMLLWTFRPVARRRYELSMGGSSGWRKNNHRNPWPISILCGSPPERVRWRCIFGPTPIHLMEQIGVISASSLMTWRITGAG